MLSFVMLIPSGKARAGQGTVAGYSSILSVTFMCKLKLPDCESKKSSRGYPDTGKANVRRHGENYGEQGFLPDRIM